MPPSSNSNTQVHECTFSAKIVQASMVIKFPSKLFVAWKNNSDQEITRTQKNDIVLKDNLAEFNEELYFKTFLLFDKSNQKYHKKETNLTVFLTPARKPKQQNFLGWVPVQLSEIADKKFEQQKKYQLEFGAAKNRFLIFSASLVSKVVLDKKPKDVKIDSFQALKASEQSTKLNIPSPIVEPQYPDQPKIMKAKNQKNIPQPAVEEQYPEQPKMMMNKNYVKMESGHVDNLRQPPTMNKGKLISEDGSNDMYEQEGLRRKLEQENAKLFEMMDTANDEIEKQKLNNQKMKGEVKRLQKLVEEKQIEKNDISEQLVKQIQEETQKLQKMKKLKENQQEARMEYESENLELRYELASAKQLISQLQYRLEHNDKNNINDFNVAYNILKEEKTKLQQHLMAMQKDMERMEEERRQLQSKMFRTGESNLSNEEMEEKIAYIQGQTEKLKRQVKEYEIERMSFKETIAKLEDDHSKMKKRLTENGNILSERQLELKTTRHYLENKDNEIGQLSEKISSYQNYENEIRKLEMEIKRQESIIKGMNREREEEINKKQNLTNQVTEMNKIRTQLTNRNLILENQIQCLNVKLEKGNKDLKNKEEILKERKLFVETLSKQLEEEIKNSQELQEKIQKFAEKQMKMRQNILVLEEESRKIYEIVLEKEEVQEIQNTLLGEKVDQLAHLNAELTQIKEKAQALDREKGELKKEIYMIKKEAISKNSDELFNIEADQLSNQRILELETEIVHLKEESKKKESQMMAKQSKLEKEKSSLEKEKVKVLENEKLELKNEKNDLTERNKWLEHNIRELETKISELEMEIDRTINHNKNKLFSQREEEVILKKENKTLQEEIIELEGKLIEQQRINKQNITQKHKIQMSKYEGSYNQQANSNSQLNIICQDLKVLLNSRSSQKYENTIQLLLNRLNIAEENFLKISKERGVIQQTARKLSMQFQQIKSILLKGKANMSEKKQIINALKPCEGIVKSIISLAESLSEIQFQPDD